MILLLDILEQLLELLLLLGVELVSFGAKEFPFELGDESLGLGQLLSLLPEFLLGLGQMLGLLLELRFGRCQMLLLLLKLLVGLTQLLLERSDIFHQPLGMLRRLPQ